MRHPPRRQNLPPLPSIDIDSVVRDLISRVSPDQHRALHDLHAAATALRKDDPATAAGLMAMTQLGGGAGAFVEALKNAGLEDARYTIHSGSAIEIAAGERCVLVMRGRSGHTADRALIAWHARSSVYGLAKTDRPEPARVDMQRWPAPGALQEFTTWALQLLVDARLFLADGELPPDRSA
jgi:hypothetical protein